MADFKFDFKQHLQSLKSFDWRSLQKYTSPQAAGDFNAFLEKLPGNVGQSMLLMAGVAWAAAGAMGIFTTLQLKELTTLRTSLQSADAMKPSVPVIKDVPLPPKDISDFVDKMNGIYEGLSIKATGSTIVITATDTAAFGQFREAIGHIQNGGSGWRVTIDRLCVGRECDKQPLAASLKINKVSVDKPQ